MRSKDILKKIGRHETNIFTDDDGMMTVMYRDTAVVKFDYQKIILNAGGWRTYTTKMRMNQASNQFKLGYRVYQKEGDWFVVYNKKTARFRTDMVALRRVLPLN